MNNSTPRNLPAIPLKEALLRLSVSPVKADREAISRIERETGRDIQAIIQDLDSIDVTLKAIEEQPAYSYSKLVQFVGWGFFFASLIGIPALFLLPLQRLPVAIALGFVLGISAVVRRS